MNADSLALGSHVFYPRGTTGERVPATVVGLLSFPECVAISYEHSSQTRLYYDCPVERLTFPIVRAESLASKCCLSPPHTAPSGPEHLHPTVRIVLRLIASMLRRRMTPNIFKLHLSFHKTPWATASLSEKVVQYIGK